MDNNTVIHTQCAGEDRILFASDVGMLLGFKPASIFHQITSLPLVYNHDVAVSTIDLDRPNHSILISSSNTLCLTDNIGIEYISHADSSLAGSRASIYYTVSRRVSSQLLENHLIDSCSQPFRQCILCILSHILLGFLLLKATSQADRITNLVNAYIERTVD